jgi:hypothetical protein
LPSGPIASVLARRTSWSHGPRTHGSMLSLPGSELSC